MEIVKILVRWIGLHTRWGDEIKNKIKGEEYNYPCSKCLVVARCSELCNKVLSPSRKYDRKIDGYFRKHLEMNKCLDCGCENSLINNKCNYKYIPTMITTYKCLNCNHQFMTDGMFFFGRDELFTEY